MYEWGRMNNLSPWKLQPVAKLGKIAGLDLQLQHNKQNMITTKSHVPF